MSETFNKSQMSEFFDVSAGCVSTLSDVELNVPRVSVIHAC